MTTTDAAAEGSARQRAFVPLLFVTVLVIATSGLVYELVAGTLASYVLGDSVTQFSITIGTYLFAMGIGAYLSKRVTRDVAARFVEVELGTALIGGGSAPLLFIAFAYGEAFQIVLYGTIVAVGILVGLEIPLLMRILKEDLDFEELIAKVLGFDYLGALVGSLLFALVLVPRLGLNRTSLAFGLLNALVAIGATFVLEERIERRTRLRLRVSAVVLAIGLCVAIGYAERLTTWTEQAMYADVIVHAEQTAHQRIVVTRGRGSVQLFLNGNLQFSSSDEYRYHEALVHPAFAVAPRHERVLVLGGGDGLAVREIFRYPNVREVTLVDLDPGVTRMARTVPFLRELNRRSLDDPRVHIVNDDAMVWLDQRPEGAAPYDVLIVDFPDPNNFALGKLYTTRFYSLLSRAMHDGSVAVVQSTSPLYARRSYWCIDRTMREAGFATQPYHATVPSFGEWGYVLAMKHGFDPPEQVDATGLRFLTDETLRALFVFSADVGPVEVEPNRLNDQQLVRYYEAEWTAWN